MRVPVARRLLSFFHRSLRGRLALLVGVVLLPAGVLVTWLILQGYRNERRELEQHLLDAVRATSLLVESELAEREALLRGLSTSGRLQRGELEAFREQMRSVPRSADEWIVLIDASGRQLVNTLMPPGHPLPSIRFQPEFRAAAQQGKTYISNLRFGPASGRMVVFTAISILERGELKYTLNYAMAPSVFVGALDNSGVGKNSIVSILDREMTVIARNRRAAEFVGTKATDEFVAAMNGRAEGVIESITLDGIPSITAFARSESSGWTVIIAAPASELYASAERMLVVGLGVSLLLGAAASVMAWWVGRGVVSAVQTLVRETEAVGRGQRVSEGDTGIEETNIVFHALAETSTQLIARQRELKQLNDSLTATAKALQEKQERLDAARTAAATGTFVWHLDTGAFESDEGLNALLGLREPAAIRSLEEFLALVHPENRPEVGDRLERCVRQRGDFSAEFRVSRKDGSSRHIFCRGRAFSAADTEVCYVAAACVDVTERKQHESELARARDAALAGSRAKDEFLAALSHELRTPLNPVLLVASDASQRPDFPPAAREAFALIAKNALLEARLIDDLLDLTRITRGKLLLDKQPVEIHGVLREALATVQAELDAKAQELELVLHSKPAYVHGDPTRLQQVFWNVLKNAVKFTPKGGRITVSSALSDRCVQIEIADTGMGMTPDEIGRLFRSFSQGDHALGGSAHRFGGLGLGLAISRMLVELHAGEIAARSQGRGHGSVFVIRLPLTEAPAPAEPNSGNAEPVETVTVTRQGRRVLLVEDHEATRVAVARLLQRRSYDVSVAATAADALRWSVERTFDFVISDIGLPDTDGYALMRHLRDRHGLRGVALTGYGMEEDIERGRAAGFVAHLTKPIDIQKLDAVLSRIANGNHDAG